MLLEAPVNYAGGLHWCRFCKAQHRLDVLPHREGFIAGVRCKCREPNGTPRRYSIESGPFPTFQRADTSRKGLLRLARSAARNAEVAL